MYRKTDHFQGKTGAVFISKEQTIGRGHINNLIMVLMQFGMLGH